VILFEAHHRFVSVQILPLPTPASRAASPRGGKNSLRVSDWEPEGKKRCLELIESNNESRKNWILMQILALVLMKVFLTIHPIIPLK
jgi:hypothetical protein